MAQLRVGIAGWTYAPWRGNFYPPGLKQALELSFASRRFRMLEVNGTFYSLQSPKTFSEWYTATPDDFAFTVKGNNYVTHIRRLKEPRQALANFFASGILCLKEKLGAVLWQLPPNLAFDESRCAEFVKLLPRDTHELAKLGEEHDAYVKKGVQLTPDAKRPVRHAIETRHESFLNEKYFSLLREHNIAHVVADADSLHPTSEDITADFIYVRLHGERTGHASGYTLEEIQAWASRIKTWSQGKEPTNARRFGKKSPPAKKGRDVFVNFDNTEDKLLSPVNARQMAEALGIERSGDTTEQILESLNIKLKPTPGQPKSAKPKPAQSKAAKPKATKAERKPPKK